MNNNWIKKDTLPPVSDHRDWSVNVLLGVKVGSLMYYEIGYYSFFSSRWIIGNDEDGNGEVKYWTLLPEFPKD